MDVIFDWNLGNKIYHGLITLRLCGFPFAEIEVVSMGEAARPVWGPHTLYRLVLLPTIYFVDSKVVLSPFIQWWSREMMRIDDVTLP
jgi:hypothetical protein